jgi:ATP-dependent Clp protease ATP-binding subunit ClpB
MQTEGKYEAIDLLDEATAKLKIEISAKPIEIEKVDRQILQLELERLSLQKESDPASKERLGELEKELIDLKEEQQVFNAQWKLEKETIDRIQSIKEEIERVNVEIEQAERDYNLMRAAELKYCNLPDLYRQLEAAEDRLKQSQRSGKSLLREEVNEDDIAEVVAQWTDIPVNQLLESEG